MPVLQAAFSGADIALDSAVSKLLPVSGGGAFYDILICHLSVLLYRLVLIKANGVNMSLIRPTAVAGTFYNEDANILRDEIAGYVKRNESESETGIGAMVPKALIAPHAGHVYSGYCAVKAYLTIPEAKRQKITRIVLLGPAHHFAANGMAVTKADLWECPLGAMEIDRQAVTVALQFDQVEENDIPHMNEHCLEVHVPFFKHFFPNAKLLPFAVTNLDEGAVAQVLEALWGGEETLIVISTDLSHYHAYDEAMRLDLETADWIESYNGSLIDGKHACGHVPMSGLLAVARQKNMQIERVYMMNSGDAMGDKATQVVGYGSWALQ